LPIKICTAVRVRAATVSCSGSMPSRRSSLV
jgi:hypothetical protein